jgi:Kef-type K+ transport system membrane component KefB
MVVRNVALLGAFGALVFYVTRAVPDVDGDTWAIASVGLLLFAGTLTSELTAPLGLPHLTGYLLAGIVSGPHVLRLVDARTLESVSPVNTLALSLIALAGGAELDFAAVRRSATSLGWGLTVQTALVFTSLAAVFLLARPMIPFARGLPLAAAAGVALCWASLAVSRSPSATLALLSQTRASGPLATYTLAFVMASDVVVVILLAIVIGVVRPLVDPGASFALSAFGRLGHEIFGSVAIGTTLGLVIAAYLRLVNRQMLVVLLVLGFGVSTSLDYLHFDSLLSFMVAGVVVRNLSAQGQKFVKYVEQTGTIVYVVFFAIAGADLNLPLLRALWPVALILAGARALATWAAARAAARLAHDPPALQAWGWSGLVSQAGLTLGLSVLVAREFPSVGAPFRALVIATVAINELVGPVLFKLALDRAGETSTASRVSFPSMGQ